MNEADPPQPARPSRQIFRPVAIARFTQAAQSGLPDGTIRPTHLLFWLAVAIMLVGVCYWAA